MTDSHMATMLVKLENYNPAGSVRDRMAWNTARRAEEAGRLGAGATLVESASGNAGLGLAMTGPVQERDPREQRRRVRRPAGEAAWTCG